MGPKPIRTLHELAALRDAMRRRAQEAAAEAERERAERAAQRARERQFADAVGAVTPLPAHGRALAAPPRPAPQPRQREADERAALREAWSDEIDVESLLLTDDGLSFRRPGVHPDVVTRLRRGQWAVQGQIDLHGLRRDEAREALRSFLGQAQRQSRRCVRVVHGKGLGSPGREPVLKGKVQRWLAQAAGVLAFAQASAPQGGAGALLVLLDRRD